LSLSEKNALILIIVRYFSNNSQDWIK